MGDMELAALRCVKSNADLAELFCWQSRSLPAITQGEANPTVAYCLSNRSQVTFELNHPFKNEPVWNAIRYLYVNPEDSKIPDDVIIPKKARQTDALPEGQAVPFTIAYMDSVGFTRDSYGTVDMKIIDSYELLGYYSRFDGKDGSALLLPYSQEFFDEHVLLLIRAATRRGSMPIDVAGLSLDGLSLHLEFSCDPNGPNDPNAEVDKGEWRALLELNREDLMAEDLNALELHYSFFPVPAILNIPMRID